MRYFLVASVIVLLCSLRGFASDLSVYEIIDKAIARRTADVVACSSLVCQVTAQSIKYDKHFSPKEITQFERTVYFSGKRVAARIHTVIRDGKALIKKDSEKEVEKLLEKWRDEQKKDESKRRPSRSNFVDPLLSENRNSYTFKLIGKVDTVLSVANSTVAAIGFDGDSLRELIDQSVEKLTSYYVVEFTSQIKSDRHINGAFWIDSKTFGVIRVKFSPAKLPGFVHRLDFRIDYEPIGSDSSFVYLHKRFEIKGKAGFLFFKGRFGVIEDFSDCRCQADLSDDLFELRYDYVGD